MKNKPFIFTVLSILCLIEPIIKVLYFKAITHFDFFVILANLRTRNSFVEIFDFWLVFPIAGILLLKLRKWTYFAFMSVLTYVLYKITTYEEYTWPYNSDSPFMYNYVVAFLSLAAFAYLLLPKARQPFFDRKVRWWEPKTRYNVRFACKLHSQTLSFNGEILNISESGAFIKETPYLKLGDRFDLEFYFMGQRMQIPAEVIHHRSTGVSEPGLGIKFVFSSLAQKFRLIKIIRVIKNSHAVFNNQKDLKIVA